MASPSRPQLRWSARAKWLVFCFLLAGVYVVGGKLGLLLAGANPSATAVWPPTGIAIAALLIGGRKWWPGVFVGAFVTNITTAGSVATSLGIATGNTLEAVVAVTLVIHFANGRAAFERGVDIVKYAALAGLFATAISATIGVGTLYLGGLVDAASATSVWSTWWLGDVVGAIIIAPAILIWSRADSIEFTRARAVETIAFLVVALGVGVALVSPASAFGEAALPLAFLMVPLVLWPAIRLGRHATVSVVILLAAVALAGTVAGGGPFQSARPEDRLLLLQAFLVTVSFVGLGLAASVAERRAIERALRASQRELEARVTERTASLSDAVNALEHEARERERVHEELQLRERLSHKANEMARLGSWHWNYATNAVTWSPLLFDILGLDPVKDGASFSRYMGLIHPDDLARVEAEYGRAVELRAPMSLEYRIVRDDGQTRHLRVSGHISNAERGGPGTYDGVVQDVTDQVMAAHAEAKAAERQAELDRLKAADEFRSQLLGAVSHELKTPLTPLKLQLHMLGRGMFGTLNDRQTRAISILERNLSRLALLVDQTLDIARIEGDRLVLDRKPTDVSVVIRETVETYEDAAKEVHVRLQLDIKTELRADADANRLAQVLFNLLSNAVKFTAPEGTVRVTASSHELGVLVEVTDSGAGIDPEELPRLFRPFSQLTDGTSRKGGTGLGLFISQGIVEAHGGKLSATSPGRGHGTTFRFWIPSTRP